MKKTIITIISLLFLIVLFSCENSDKLSRREFEKIVDENIEVFDFAYCGLDLKKYEFLRSKTDTYESKEYDYVHATAEKKISSDEYLFFDGYYEIRFDLYDQEKVFDYAYEETYLDGYENLPAYVEVRDKSIEGHYEIDYSVYYDNVTLDITYLDKNTVQIEYYSSYIDRALWSPEKKENIYSGETKVKGIYSGVSYYIKDKSGDYYIEFPIKDTWFDFVRVYFYDSGNKARLIPFWEDGKGQELYLTELIKK